MKKFWESLREHAMKIANFEKIKTMNYILIKQTVIFAEKGLNINTLQIKIIIKLETIAIIQENKKNAAHSICNLKYSIPKKIPAVFHKGSTYNYNFIIKEQAKEFEGEFNCLGENTETYKTLPVPITKEASRTDKNRGRDHKNNILRITIY